MILNSEIEFKDFLYLPEVCCCWVVYLHYALECSRQEDENNAEHLHTHSSVHSTPLHSTTPDIINWAKCVLWLLFEFRVVLFHAPFCTVLALRYWSIQARGHLIVPVTSASRSSSVPLSGGILSCPNMHLNRRQRGGSAAGGAVCRIRIHMFGNRIRIRRSFIR